MGCSVTKKLDSKRFRRACFLLLFVVLLCIGCDHRFLLFNHVVENTNNELVISDHGWNKNSAISTSTNKTITMSNEIMSRRGRTLESVGALDSDLVVKFSSETNRSRMKLSRDLQDAVVKDEKMATEGIFWTNRIERWIPEGIGSKEAWEVTGGARQQGVSSVEGGTMHRCGKAPNAFVTLTNNHTFCAKPGQSSHYSVLGELFSFHLSRILGMDNVPPVLLSYVSVTSHSLWNDVTDNMASLRWLPDMYVALINWIPELMWKGAGVTVPALITEFLTTGTTLTPDTVSKYLNRTSSGLDGDNYYLQEMEKELARLAQWGTMVIFDYITGNHDRATGLTETSSHVRNLQQTTDGKFWLIDNEANLFHSYQLIHRGSTTGRRLQRAHLRHLQSTCLFQRSLVRHLMDFVRKGDPAGALIAQVRIREPLFHHMTVDSDSRRLFVKLFSRRVFEVMEWIVHCHSMNSE